MSPIHKCYVLEIPDTLIKFTTTVLNVHIPMIHRLHDDKSIRLCLYCWFSHDVTKIQPTKLSILLRFYFHGVLEQLKTNFQTNFRFKRVLGFVIEYA